VDWSKGQNPGRKPEGHQRALAREADEPRRTGFDLQGQFSLCGIGDRGDRGRQRAERVGRFPCSRPRSRLCQRGGVSTSSSTVTRGGSGTQHVFAPSIISARRSTSACIASRKRVQSARNSSETKSPGRLGVPAPSGVSGCSFGPGITPHLCVETVDNSELVEPQTPQRFGP
jgi:hypothetical protein